MERKTRTRRTKPQKLFHKIMADLYKASTPPVDWEELLSSPEDVIKAFDFHEYFLDEDTFNKIVEDNLRQSRLTRLVKGSIKWQIYLGASPVTNPEAVKKKDPTQTS